MNLHWWPFINKVLRWYEVKEQKIIVMYHEHEIFIMYQMLHFQETLMEMSQILFMKAIK